MTDERGGRYFREARFFLAGDKVAAQSHISEARMLMGYMRDQLALGGPAIQAQYATLQDGTQIKATMMNGQLQAEIVSPPPLPNRPQKPCFPLATRAVGSSGGYDKVARLASNACGIESVAQPVDAIGNYFWQGWDLHTLFAVGDPYTSTLVDVWEHSGAELQPRLLVSGISGFVGFARFSGRVFIVQKRIVVLPAWQPVVSEVVDGVLVERVVGPVINEFKQRFMQFNRSGTIGRMVTYMGDSVAGTEPSGIPAMCEIVFAEGLNESVEITVNRPSTMLGYSAGAHLNNAIQSAPGVIDEGGSAYANFTLARLDAWYQHSVVTSTLFERVGFFGDYDALVISNYRNEFVWYPSGVGSVFPYVDDQETKSYTKTTVVYGDGDTFDLSAYRLHAWSYDVPFTRSIYNVLDYLDDRGTVIGYDIQSKAFYVNKPIETNQVYLPDRYGGVTPTTTYASVATVFNMGGTEAVHYTGALGFDSPIFGYTVEDESGSRQYGTVQSIPYCDFAQRSPTVLWYAKTSVSFVPAGHKNTSVRACIGSVSSVTGDVLDDPNDVISIIGVW